MRDQACLGVNSHVIKAFVTLMSVSEVPEISSEVFVIETFENN